MIANLRPGNASSSPGQFKVHGGKLFFSATDGSLTHDLWVSNGTASGTVKVRPVAAGGPINPHNLTSTSERLYFAAFQQGGTLPGVWKSDGTAAGTKPVASLPGVESSSTRESIAVADKLFMVADTLEHGRELWALDLKPVLSLEQPSGTALPAIGAEVVWDLSGPVTPTKSFVVRNAGESNLSGLQVMLDPPDTAAFEISTQGMSATLAPDESTTFTVTRQGPVGPQPMRLRVFSSNPAVPAVEVNLAEFIPVPALSWDPSTVVLNRQTGLYELRLTLANGNAVEISGFKIHVSGLPAGVTLRGASADGEILYPGSIPAGGTVELLLEFHATSRTLGEFAPEIRAEIADENLPQPSANSLAVDRIEWLGDAVLIEFPAIAGRRYQIDYRNGSAGEWKTSPMILEAGSNRLQFIDRGPPHTETSPAQSASRFYRFSEIAP